MALLLAFDTATPHLSVVLAHDGVPVTWRTDATPALSHAEKLNVFIVAVLEEAGLGLAQLDAVAVGTGPGSYTGLRIGLSAAKGLCFALDKPLIGMGTLDILVAEWRSSCPGTGVAQLWPMVDARRMEVYTRPYAPDGLPQGDTAPLVLDEAWCTAHSAAAPAVFGDGADKAVELWRAAPWVKHVAGVRPGINGLARCAENYFRQGRFSDLAYLVPEYGKPANVAQQRGAS